MKCSRHPNYTGRLKPEDPGCSTCAIVHMEFGGNRFLVLPLGWGEGLFEQCPTSSIPRVKVTAAGK